MSGSTPSNATLLVCYARTYQYSQPIPNTDTDRLLLRLDLHHLGSAAIFYLISPPFSMSILNVSELMCCPTLPRFLTPNRPSHLSIQTSRSFVE